MTSSVKIPTQRRDFATFPKGEGFFGALGTPPPAIIINGRAAARPFALHQPWTNQPLIPGPNRLQNFFRPHSRAMVSRLTRNTLPMKIPKMVG